MVPIAGCNVVRSGNAEHVCHPGNTRLTSSYLLLDSWTMQWGAVRCCKYIVSLIVSNVTILMLTNNTSERRQLRGITGRRVSSVDAVAYVRCRVRTLNIFINNVA